MKLRVVLHMRCRSSPGQTDTTPGFDCVSTLSIGLKSKKDQEMNNNMHELIIFLPESETRQIKDCISRASNAVILTITDFIIMIMISNYDTVGYQMYH